MKTTYREPISKGLRFDVLHRDRFTCQYCGNFGPTVQLVIDHVIPVASGGRSVKTNLVTACRPCNAGKAAKLLHNHPHMVCLTADQLHVLELIADAEVRVFYRHMREPEIGETSLRDEPEELLA